MSSQKRRSRAERAAESILERYGVTEPPIDVAALAASEGAEVRFVDARADVSGMLVQEGTSIVIGVNRQHHRNRQRFTIAHELGHWVLHQNKQPALFVDETMVYFRDSVSSRATDQREIQANTFGASLLMPRALLHHDLSGKRLDVNDDNAIRRLARRYQVSVQALTLRLAWLGLVEGLAPTS